jgi:hypothetical protein
MIPTAGMAAEVPGRWAELRARIVGDMTAVDSGLYRASFGGTPKRSGLPGRVGYLVGYRGVRSLSRRSSIAEMARWSPERAAAEVWAALEATDDRPPAARQSPSLLATDANPDIG